MANIEPEIRKLAGLGLIKYTRHAAERIQKYGLTTMQVATMLKNCNLNQSLGDANGYRVEGRAPAMDTTGSIEISAHVKIYDYLLMITVINS